MSAHKRFRPLDAPLAKEFEQAANEHPDFLTSLTGRTLLLLGLRPKTYTHTLPPWIERRGNDLVFAVKPYPEVDGIDHCIQGAGEVGSQDENPTDLHNTDGQPCADCRATKGPDTFLGKTNNTPRTFPLDEPEMRDIGEDLLWWFERNSRIPFSGDGVNRRVRKIAENTSIPDKRGYKQIAGQGKVPDINAYDLRHTYGTRLARMGFNEYEIMSWMGHGSPKIPQKYIEFTGTRKRQTMDEKWDSDVY